jgi:hypothetical protein
MVWIESHGERTTAIAAPLERVFAFLLAVDRSGVLWPSVERIEALGELKFRWVLPSFSTLGHSFKPDYVAQYSAEGRDLIRWAPSSGNVEARGSYRLRELGAGRTELVYATSSRLDIPIPGILKTPARLFAENELKKGLASHVEALKKALEGAAS